MRAKPGTPPPGHLQRSLPADRPAVGGPCAVAIGFPPTPRRPAQMFVVNDPPPQIAPERLALLLKAEPATIGHFRQVGFMDPAIHALLPDRRIAGTAVTIRFDGDDTSIVHYALGKLRPGDVLVMDRAGDMRHACCGGGVAFAARAAGCLGIIIDGVATDIQELRAYAMPVWARGLSPITCKPRFVGGELD